MIQRPQRLRSKLVAIFAGLVGIPLLLTGILLSIAGRNSVLESGSSLNRIGAGSFQDAADQMSSIMMESSKTFTQQLVHMGHDQLSHLSQQQSKRSADVLQHAGGRLLKTGDALMKQSSERMIDASANVVKQSGSKLRGIHQQAIEEISEAVILEARDAFIRTGKDLAQTNESTVLNLSKLLNQQRSRAVAEQVELFFAQDVKELIDSGKTALAAAVDDLVAARNAISDIRIEKTYVMAVAAVMPDGSYLANSPPVIDPRTRARWKPVVEETVFTESAQTSELAFTPPRGWVMALTAPVIGKGGDLSMVLVVDILLSGIQTRVEATAAATRTYISITDPSGMVIANSRSRSAIGKEAPGDERAILNEAKQIEQMPLYDVLPTLTYGAADDQQLCAFWKVKPFGWMVLVREPMKSILDTTKRMRETMINSANAAAELMGDAATTLAEKKVNQVKPLQDRILSSASSGVKIANARVLNTALGQLKAKQTAVTKEAIANSQADTGRSAEAAALTMKEEAERATAEAMLMVKERASESARKGLLEMRSRTIEGANKAARRMIRQSVFLLAGFLCLAILMAAGTASSIVQPITHLADGAGSIAAGDYSKRVDVRSNDEIGQLAMSFNSMAAAVQQSSAELEHSYDVLSREKSRLLAIVESTPDGLLTRDDRGYITILNAATIRLLSLPQEVPLNQPLDPVDWGDRASEQIRECVAVAKQSNGIGTDLVVDGDRPTILLVRSVNVHDEMGRTHGQLIHLHDITQEREMDQMKTEFVSLVSHELRTPLTSILGFSSYLLTGKLGELTAEQRTALESMYRQSNRLKAIISDFLDISRIESGRVEMAREHIVVEDIAKRVVEELKPNWSDKGLLVNVASNGHSPHIAIGDEERIAQVFTNLVGNAIKFTDTGGHVTISVDTHDREVIVAVQDTGVGIPEDELPRIFDRFYQVEKVVTRKTGGTGLGLTIVKNIVEAHGGMVTVESALGHGTMFRFTLPAASRKVRNETD